MFKDKKLLSLLGLSFISFFSTIWVRKADLMESRNFITAREIVLNNEWLVTTLNGQYRFEKPPLPTWLTAIVMKMSGNFSDEWILRIPVALCSILLIFFIYRMVQELSKDDNLAFISAFIASTTFMLTKVGSENAWDAYPYIFMFGSITYLIKNLRSEKKTYLFLAGVFLGSSLLSKGPVALYGMFIPFLISYGVIFGFKTLKINKWRIAGYLAIGIALASIWPIAMLIENKDLFLSVMMKEKDTWSSKHVRGFFFYLNYFLFMGGWIFFSVATFLRKWSFKNENKNKIFKFGFIWTVLTFLFLSVVKMKKERYGFPIYIVSSIPIGVVLNYYLNTDWNILEKFDKLLFRVQSWLLFVVAIGGIGLVFWKRFNMFYLAIPFLILLFVLIKSYSKNKNILKQRVIYLTGLSLILVNSSLTWIIEKDIRSKKSVSIQSLETLQKNKKSFEIYSSDFSIDDVWSVGQNIYPLTEKTELPEEFYILSKDSSFENKDKYSIEYTESYARFSDSNDLIYLYKIINK
ncbi:glycosyltransferase family 39 protein [uncultured Cetobacterium sp.]|uniref:ArnT family glycosyltransferase n=1 Tax=uncultured Cetobacterium sp. TaxID=527638 RepID=UPI0025F6302A|nr:glycosyltransferase family 39 protein [uncultured Cetobacterium sp.]